VFNSIRNSNAGHSFNDGDFLPVLQKLFDAAVGERML
jgi:hypothetical protein